MTAVRRRWPFYYYTEHYLDGFGGTWFREYTVGISLRSHSISFRFAIGRFREVGK